VFGLSGLERPSPHGSRGAASHGELDLSDGGVGDLTEVAARGGTRSAEGLDGGSPKGWRREARDRSERGSVVGRSSGSQLANRRRAEGSCPRRLGDG
jgi:hypothetical protein